MNVKSSQCDGSCIKCKNIMLKNVGMAVQKTRETRAVYMPQDKRLWHTTM